MEGLRSAQISDVLVIGGGVIPNGDARALEQWCKEGFRPGEFGRIIDDFHQGECDRVVVKARS